MDRESQHLGIRFFQNAYDPDWNPQTEPEEKMLRNTFQRLTATDTLRLKQLFLNVLKLDDAKMDQQVFYDLGCRIKPFLSFNPQYRHRDTRGFITYLVSFIEDEMRAIPQSLSLDGNSLCETDGTLIATLNSSLGDKTAAYARLFSLSAEIVDFLEKQINRAGDEYERAFMDAEKFNTDITQPGRGGVYGWKDKTYPNLPEWIKEGHALMARIKGEDGTEKGSL